MYDLSYAEVWDDAAEERTQQPVEDVHPYMSCVLRRVNDTVPFPKITKFNIYLLRHFGASIVDEINEMLYDGQLAAVCGVEGFCCPRLTHEQCRIDPRMAFWRVNKCEFIADLTIHLKACVWDGEDTEDRVFTLYVSLNSSIYDEISYEFSSVSFHESVHTAALIHIDGTIQLRVAQFL